MPCEQKFLYFFLPTEMNDDKNPKQRLLKFFIFCIASKNRYVKVTQTINSLLAFLYALTKRLYNAFFCLFLSQKSN